MSISCRINIWVTSVCSKRRLPIVPIRVVQRRMLRQEAVTDGDRRYRASMTVLWWIVGTVLVCMIHVGRSAASIRTAEFPARFLEPPGLRDVWFAGSDPCWVGVLGFLGVYFVLALFLC